MRKKLKIPKSLIEKVINQYSIKLKLKKMKSNHHRLKNLKISKTQFILSHGDLIKLKFSLKILKSGENLIEQLLQKIIQEKLKMFRIIWKRQKNFHEK